MTQRAYKNVECPACQGRGHAGAASRYNQRAALPECRACKGYGVIPKSFMVAMQAAQRLAAIALRGER